MKEVALLNVENFGDFEDDIYTQYLLIQRMKMPTCFIGWKEMCQRASVGVGRALCHIRYALGGGML